MTSLPSLRRVLITSCVCAVLATIAHAQALVYPGHLEGWDIRGDLNSGGANTIEFVAGPTGSLDDLGSLHLVGATNGLVTLSKSDFTTGLGSLGNFAGGYRAQQVNADPSGPNFKLEIFGITGVTATWKGSLVFEPYYQSGYLAGNAGNWVDYLNIENGSWWLTTTLPLEDRQTTQMNLSDWESFLTTSQGYDTVLVTAMQVSIGSTSGSPTESYFDYVDYSFDGGATTLRDDFVAVPEPSTYAALMGLAVLGIVGYKRFRRRSA